MILPTTLAYLAGMIDGDGFISITRSVRKGKVYHAPQVGIAGTRREPHDLAASIWGGAVYAYVPKNTAHRTQFQWSRVGGVAAEIIEAIQPYLLIKRDHAELALELWENICMGHDEDPFPWFGPAHDPTAARDDLRAEMVDLNQSRNRLRSLPAVAQ